MISPENKQRTLDVWLGLTGKTPLPEGPLYLPILSGSMRPIIPLESQILITPCDSSQCRIGDVAVYIEGDKLVAHRILWFLGSRAGGWFFSKGDANAHGRWARCQSIKGRVKEVHWPSDESNPGSVHDPFSQEAAKISRRNQLRNIILAFPRYIKGLIFRQTDSNESETPS